jgi:hypothetical protein
MSLNSTYYKNTTRTISGLINPVFDTDVVLLCDTSAGAVELQLPKIPTDNFSTQYRLYVVDKSNNASANNITIKAPTGFSVNNSITAVINVNSGTAIVNISSNKTYNAQFNYQVGGIGNPISIKNEGTTITPNVSSIDFVGNPVTATAVGNDVTVKIEEPTIVVQNEGVEITPNVQQFNFVGNLVNATAVGNNVQVEVNSSPPIPVTYNNILNLIEAVGLIPSQIYQITNANYIQSVVPQLPDPNYIKTVPIYVVALSSTTISMDGDGYFLNVDYGGFGNYSGVTGFVQQKFLYENSETYVIGDVVIWRNGHWLNLTGVNSVPSSSNPDWQFLPQNITNGYIPQICKITYEVETNNIKSRQDPFLNYVENNFFNYAEGFEAFLEFKWGIGARVYQNSVTNQSCFTFCDVNVQSVIANTLKDASFIFIQRNSAEVNLFLANNFLTSEITFSNAKGTIANNTFINNQSPDTIISVITNNCELNSNEIIGLKEATIQLNDNSKFNRNRIDLRPIQEEFKVFITATIFNDNFFQKTGKIGIVSTGGNFERNTFLAGSGVGILANSGNISFNYFFKSVLTLGENFNQFTNNSVTQDGEVEINEIGVYGIVNGNNINTKSKIEAKFINGLFQYNTISGASEVGIETLQGLNTPSTGKFEYNTIKNSCNVFISEIELGGKFWYNTFLNGSRIVNGIIVKGEAKYNQFDNNSDLEIIGVDTNGVFNDNYVNNFSKIKITELLQGVYSFNKLNIGSLIEINNVLKVGVDNGELLFNELHNSIVTLQYVNQDGVFNYNTLSNSSNITCKDISGKFTFNVLNVSTIELQDNLELTAEIKDNQFQKSTLNIIEALTSNFKSNQLTSSNFTFNKTTSPSSDGVFGNVLVNSVVGFGNVVKGFIDNNLTQSVYLAQNPISKVLFDIIDYFRSNDWNRTEFLIENGNQFGSIEDTLVNGGFFQRDNFSYVIKGGVCQDGIATIQYALDLNDITIYDPVAKRLTIPTNMERFFGVYVLLNGTGQVIEKISNLSLDFPTKFITDGSSVGFSIDFVVLNNQFGTGLQGICSTSTAPYPQTFPIRFQSISDYIVIDNQGNGVINLINQYNAYP